VTARDIAISAALWVGLFILAALFVTGMEAAGIIRDTTDWTGSGSVKEFVSTTILCLTCGIVIGRFSPGSPHDVAIVLFNVGAGEIVATLVIRSIGNWQAALFALLFCIFVWIGGLFGVRTRPPPLP
jgi:hypothetical protein